MWIRGAKSILVLAVLLSFSSRGEASFVLGRLDLESDEPSNAVGHELKLLLRGEEHGSTGAGTAETMPQPAHEPLESPSLPREPWRTPADLLSPTSTTGAGSPGPGSSAGSSSLQALPPTASLSPQVEVIARLFLADERLRLPPFPTKIFRPPRPDHTL